MSASPRGGPGGVRGTGSVRASSGQPGSIRGGTGGSVRGPRPRDPYGIGLPGGPAAPVLAAIGLVVVAVVTLSLSSGQLPFVSGGSGGNGSGGTAIETAAPPSVIVRPPEATFQGQIVYAKQGAIWIQDGRSVRQLTSGANDIEPTWAADGSAVYFIRQVADRGLFPVGGNPPTWYDLSVPLLMRVSPQGGAVQQLATGKYSIQGGRYQWSYWIREPVPSPDGSTIAVVSDGPNPLASDMAIQLFNPATKKLTRLALAENAPLGLQDPAWRPDGRQILYVRNSRDGPSIWRYDLRTKKASALTGVGYLAPAYSPDMRFVAATKTSRLGTDVVILDAQRGTVVAQVTADGASWSPTWSPAGDALAFLHVRSGIVDLRMATLDLSGGGVAVKATTDLTTVSGLDGTSRPSWFIPADQLPTPAPSPSAAAPAGSSPAGSGSSQP